jgi:hypothetical protein
LFFPALNMLQIGMNMTPPERLNWVSVKRRCSRHHRQRELCVKVPVPEPIRCTPSGGVGGDGASDGCTCHQLATADIVRVVTNILRGERGKWVRLGEVIVDC